MPLVPNMKLSSLFEMPTLINKELSVYKDRFQPFYSSDSVEKMFDVVWRQSDKPESYCVLIEKDRTFAVWGIMTTDPKREGVEGVEIISIVDFKDGLNIKTTIPFDPANTLQIDLVQTTKRSQQAGIATELYLKLAHAGFTIISDNEQWIGGMKLWKKLAKVSVLDKHAKVFLLRYNKLKPYNGINIPDDEIWSEDSKHKYTLFVLKSTI